MYNLYGPTETTIFASSHDCTPQLSECYNSTPLQNSVKGDVGIIGGGGDVPIGTPLPDTTFVVVDQFLSPVPVGVGGELVLMGGCLSLGYVGRVGGGNEDNFRVCGRRGGCIEVGIWFAGMRYVIVLSYDSLVFSSQPHFFSTEEWWVNL